MQLRNAIWDFDGTLADTYDVILASLQATLQHFNYDAGDRQELYRFIKLHSVKAYFQKVTPPASFAQIFQYHQQLDHQSQNQVQLLPGATTVLREIIQKGGHNYLWTHRDDLVLEILERQHIRQYFTAVISSQQHFERKPSPQALNYLVQTYNLKPDVSAMIGDRALDIQAGKNAGLQTIYYDVDNFHDSNGADQIVTQLPQIINFF
ncbi:HAD-IA family hydrolase [Bombilactobacillus bombi]|uniref:HAD-IA family hydrolase n=1 Tax=Bombilactobacillus bombi TaxID=1303590 RepID=UPI0015E5BC78|nr:HAD-IA family hydrolase [Bombilactobacillus bombi]